MNAFSCGHPAAAAFLLFIHLIIGTKIETAANDPNNPQFRAMIAAATSSGVFAGISNPQNKTSAETAIDPKETHVVVDPKIADQLNGIFLRIKL